MKIYLLTEEQMQAVIKAFDTAEIWLLNCMPISKPAGEKP